MGVITVAGAMAASDNRPSHYTFWSYLFIALMSWFALGIIIVTILETTEKTELSIRKSKETL
jgi:hypothetical protein